MSPSTAVQSASTTVLLPSIHLPLVSNPKTTLEVPNNPLTQESVHIARASIDIWHRRLGHAMTQSIKKLVDQSMVTGMEAETEEDGAAHTHCILCLKGKRTRDVIPKKLNVENPRRLHRIYSDVCGLFDVEEYSRCRYFVTFVDGFSHYVRIKPIRTKDEASKVLMNWIT